MRCLNCGHDGIPPKEEICPRCSVHLPTLLRDVLPPDTLLRGGVYSLDYALGWGGFGITYLATHVTLEQRVAVKEFFPREHVLRLGRTGQVSIKTTQRHGYEQALHRFMREGRTLARLGKLNIPGVVRVQDLFEENCTGYLVMELISPARTLREELDAQQGKQFAPSRVEAIVGQLVGALEAVHGEGVYHLDISPDNVLLRPDDSAVLIDFGASRQGLGTKTTQAFKLEYAAPEVIAGGEVGPGSDLFELGMMACEMLSGQRPPSALSRLTGRGWEPAGFSEKWQKLLEQALKLPREERPGSVKDWWQEALVAEAPAGDKGQGQGVILPLCVSCGSGVGPRESMCRACVTRTVETAVASTRAAAPPAGPQQRMENNGGGEARPAPFATPAKAHVGWKVATSVLSAVTLILILIAVSIAGRYSNTWSSMQGEEKKRKALEQELTSEKAKSSRLDSELSMEKSKREGLASKYPIQITEIKLRNEAKDNKSLGGFTTTFDTDDIRYITWHVTLKSNWEGDKTVTGDLYVKYIKPDGTLSRNTDSPSDYTQKQSFSVKDTADISRGWGNDASNTYSMGINRLQFWYEGKLIGEKTFYVY